MLANKLHKSLYGTPYVGNKSTTPEKPVEIPTQTALISIKYNKPGKSADLEDLRNTKALRVPRGSAGKILAHDEREALILFLELKALVTASVIFSDDGKLPYKRIRKFTGESFTTIRNRIRALKRLSLCRVISGRHIRLASFREFRRVVGITCKRTHKILNNGNTLESLRLIAINENIERQTYVVKRKIFARELLEMKATSNGLDPVNPTKRIYAKDCHGITWNRAFIRKFKKHFNKSWDFYRRKYEKIYNKQIEQIALGMPDINPETTLSCQGTARACGLTSRSSGHRIQVELESRKLLKRDGYYRFLDETSPAIFETNYIGNRSDVFSFRYPTRREGMKRKYFLRCCNQLTPLIERIQRKTITT